MGVASADEYHQRQAVPVAELMDLGAQPAARAAQGVDRWCPSTSCASVMYLVGYPNLLVSLHPDYGMTHLMTPLAVDRTHVECA